MIRAVPHAITKQQTHKMHAIDSWMSPHILLHVPVVHPLGHWAELKQPVCNTLNAQNLLVRKTLNVEDVFVSYPPIYDNLFAVFLRERHR